MKSFQIELADYLSELIKADFSELKVLQSASGYYIGTVLTDEYGVPEPGSRDSGYFSSKESAEEALTKLESIARTNSIPEFIIQEWEAWLYNIGSPAAAVGYKIGP